MKDNIKKIFKDMFIKLGIYEKIEYR
jgi:hypothetical protein